MTNLPTVQTSEVTPRLLQRRFPRRFLIFAGIVLPLACLLFDPVVFQLGSIGTPVFHEPLLWRWQPFAYAAALLSILLATIYLFRPPASPARLGLLAGAFAGSSLLSLVLGCYLLPTSLFGLLMFIGIFGFSPFLTSVAYFLAARRLYREISPARPRPLAIVHFLLGAALYLGSAYSLHVALDRGFTSALAAAADGRSSPLSLYCRAFGDFRLLHAYGVEPIESRRQHLAEAYEQLTGLKIDPRLDDLND